ncbi:MAG: molybdopterin molybdotransferase MoeA [Bryobacterales bacterium]|nr:molybdopterin molybdotransferase MoeA [Bryobacterales bacterium]
MATLSFEDARQCVFERIRAAIGDIPSQDVSLVDVHGRVLGEDIRADRDYPPLARSVRDGFAVRSQDLPGELTLIGEVAAGDVSAVAVGSGQAIEIMTGAPLPDGADAVLMVEHAVREGTAIRTERAVRAGEFVNFQGSEAKAGDVLTPRGVRAGFAEVALLASVGRTHIRVYNRPRVAILATGNEIVEVKEPVLPQQIRNSNAHSLAAQVQRAGGVPSILPVAKDQLEMTAKLIGEGLDYDLLLISGGVSAGKYDVVEQALARHSAEFYFDRVRIQPGQPLVFGRARGTFFFGLPGNPASTMVTFEVFARAALDLLGGQTESLLPLTLARLTRGFTHKPGLTRFLPAHLSGRTAEITPIPWQGSSDVPALSRANAFLVADAEQESWKAGDLIQVLLK